MLLCLEHSSILRYCSEEDLKKANSSKQEAMDSVAKGEQKLNLAQRLTNALSSENQRWAENILVLREDAKLLTGDVLLTSAFISYIGPFTKPFRMKLMNDTFKPYLVKEFQKAVGEDGKMPMSQETNPLKILTTSAEIAQWNADSLPADVVSTENGSIVCNTSRWPLIIDPQLQGIQWLRNKESGKDRNLQIVRLGQKGLIRKLEAALEHGYTILIENLGESIDAVLNPVIQRATIKRGSRYFIKVGDKECDFHPDFRLYLHTKLSNPHYPPEIQAETTLVNFTVTMVGLEDQLLSLVVQKERPDLAALSEDLIKQQNGFTIQMKKLEDNILQKLASAEGDITEDVTLIEGYIYSLASFQEVFFRGIDTAKPTAPDSKNGEKDLDIEGHGEESSDEFNSEQIEARCHILLDSITLTVFNYIRRGLFEIDKLTVATLVTLKILVNDGKMDPDEVNYLVMGKTSVDPGNMGPLHEWMPESIWPKIKALESMPRFKGLGDNMQSDSEDWCAWFDIEKAETAKFPGDYEQVLTPFDKLILLRAMRPDRLMNSLGEFIGNTMGKEYVVQKPFHMKSTYEETTNKIPVFFVLFAGVDPTPWVENLGMQHGISTENKKFVNISMGQGQEAPAEAIVTRFAKEGGWVMLQNCHLMSSWVPKLERLLEVVTEDAHKDFRCFISAEPPPIASWRNMPESLMQTCVKVANEAPADVQSNLIRAWDNFSRETIEASSRPNEMKACLFSLCWFHAVVCGRRRFGQQGWSRKYSFNTGDLIICSNVLRSYLDANPVVPWDDLRYIFGEIMYGGHITDPWDRRTCNTYLKLYQDPKLLDGMELAPGFKSPSPNNMSYDGYIEYAETSMPQESPVLFGLHPNAEIGYLTSSTDKLFFNVIIMSGEGGAGGDDSAGGDIVKETMSNLRQRIPDEFEMVSLSMKAKPLLSGPAGPYIVVALQECGRMNSLLSEMKNTLDDLDKGLKGQLNMSQDMEDLALALKINQWPGRNPFSKCTWEKLAWPSQKTLMAQFADMLLRVKQLLEWTSEFETPKSIWLSGLFNPNSYLTAVQQVTARKTGLALDKMTTETHVTSMWNVSEVKESAVDGTYIHGLFIEGARWSNDEDADDSFIVSETKCAGSLCESRLKELIPPMPVSYFSCLILLLQLYFVSFFQRNIFSAR